MEATRAAERGKIPRAEVDAIFDRDVSALVELERGAELDSYVDGQLNWQDLFRPFSELFTGIRLGSLTRWFDNNTFYRQPVIDAKITVRPADLRPFFRYTLMPARAPRKVILPGPFTFASLSYNAAYSTFADLIDDTAKALKRVIQDLSKAEYSYVQLNEPALGLRSRTREDFELAHHAFETCTKGFAGRTVLHIYFGDVAPVIDRLLDFPVDGIGVDFYSTPVDSLAECDFNKALACGCIDGRNSLLETTPSLRGLVEKVLKIVEPKSIALCPNCDLDFLPQPIAEKKVRLLAEAKAELSR